MIKQSLISMLVWFLALPAAATTYYLRADGTAANKAAATACSAVGTAMSIATHDGETFSAGDEIVFCCEGGTYRDQLDVPSNGSSGNQITYRNDTACNPIISGADIETTWTVAYDEATNLVTNGDLENWSSATDCDNWTEALTGTTTINREGVNQRTGTYGMRIDVDASNNYAYLRQSISLTASANYKFSYWHYQGGTATSAWMLYDTTAGDSLAADGGSWQDGINYRSIGHQGAYTEQTIEFTAVSTAGHNFDMRSWVSSSESLYWDDIAMYGQHANLFQKAVGYDAGVVIEDGVPLDFVAWDTDLATTYGNMAQGSYTFDTGGAQIVYIWSTDDADPDTHTIEVAKRDYSIYGSSKNYITIDGVIVEGSRRNLLNGSSCDNWIVNNVTARYGGGVYSGGVYLGNGIQFDTSSDDNTVDSATVYGIFDSGIVAQVWDASTTLTNTTISNSTVYNCGMAGIENNITAGNTSVISGTAISNVTIYDIGESWSGNRGGDGISIYCGAGTSGSQVSATTVTGSSIYSNADHGITMVKDSGDLTISTSALYDNTGNGIRVEDSDNPTATEIIARYNLIYSNVKDAIFWNVLNDTNGGITWYNNVFYDNGDPGQGFNVRIFQHGSGTELIKNNIFHGTDTQALYDDSGIAAGGGQDYNLFYRSSGNIVHYSGTDYTAATWGAYLTASSQDANSPTPTDPLFIDAASDDYHLTGASPAINAGTDVSLTSDYEGRAVPNGSALEIGAYESDQQMLIISFLL